MSQFFMFVWASGIGAAAGSAIGVLGAIAFLGWMFDRFEKQTTDNEKQIALLQQNNHKRVN